LTTLPLPPALDLLFTTAPLLGDTDPGLAGGARNPADVGARAAGAAAGASDV